MIVYIHVHSNICDYWTCIWMYAISPAITELVNPLVFNNIHILWLSMDFCVVAINGLLC